VLNNIAVELGKIEPRAPSSADMLAMMTVSEKINKQLAQNLCKDKMNKNRFVKTGVNI
jgi:hypothetical protein